MPFGPLLNWALPVPFEPNRLTKLPSGLSWTTPLPPSAQMKPSPKVRARGLEKPSLVGEGCLRLPNCDTHDGQALADRQYQRAPPESRVWYRCPRFSNVSIV